MPQGFSLDRPITYQIKVQEIIDKSWSDWFDGLTITFENEDENRPLTTLTGPVIDQPALRGILNRIWDLNMTLVSVNRIDDAA